MFQKQVDRNSRTSSATPGSDQAFRHDHAESYATAVEELDAQFKLLRQLEDLQDRRDITSNPRSRARMQREIANRRSNIAQIEKSLGKHSITTTHAIGHKSCNANGIKVEDTILSRNHTACMVKASVQA